jgi:cytoskeletal protein RodZ
MSDDTPIEAFDPNNGDAPTRRLPQQPGSDAPTERFGAAAAATPPPAPGSDAPTEFLPRSAAAPQRPSEPARSSITPTDVPHRKNRGPAIAAIILGVLLVVAIIVLALMYFQSGRPTPVPVATETSTPSAAPTSSASPTASPSPQATPTASATPSASATPTPSPTPTVAPAPAATFGAFSPADGSSVACFDAVTPMPVDFSWTSTNAVTAWFGTGTTDAQASPDSEVSPNGSWEAAFDCGLESQDFTVTLAAVDGEVTHNTVTLVRDLP